MARQSFSNAWEAVSDSAEEAATMTMRSGVMMALADAVEGWQITQAQAARRLGITQQRLNDLLRGMISKLSLDMLLTFASRAGLRVRLEIRRPA